MRPCGWAQDRLPSLGTLVATQFKMTVGTLFFKLFVANRPKRDEVALVKQLGRKLTRREESTANEPDERGRTLCSAESQRDNAGPLTSPAGF